jgi:Zn-dependent protease
MDFSPDQVRDALLSLCAFIVSVSVHEFGHAFMANRLGDGLPRAQGRLTLSPLAHIDLIGTIVLPLVAAFMPGGAPLIAWGKPVQTNPANYSTRRFSRRTGQMLVSAMGPLMNLVLAIVVSVVFAVLAKAHLLSVGVAEGVVRYLVMLNLVLLFFNLIPLPPLDGAPVLAGLLPERLQFIPAALRRFGVLPFFILLLSGGLRYVMQPAYRLAAAWGGGLLRIVTS